MTAAAIFDRSLLVTKADLAEVRREIAEAKLDLVKWVVGFGIVQLGGLIGLTFAILKLFPSVHP